jgi:dolichyl-diphosphooligosaccharide--protein glycosyltransferase
VLPLVLGHWFPGAVGLLGFAVLVVRRWRECTPLAPIAVMGLFTFVSGARFAMYLAPLAGLGIGYLLAAGVRRVVARLAPAGDLSPEAGTGVREVAAYTLVPYGVAVLVFFTGLQPAMARMGTRSAPAIPAADLVSIQRAAARMPPGARVWTWWDRGFAYAHVARWTVYHDGSAQYTPQTHVIAHSFVTDSPGALHAAMGQVDRIGNAGITALAERIQDRVGLLGALSAPDDTPAPEAEQYVVFSRDMLRSAAALRHVAAQPIVTKRGVPATFQVLPCTAFRDSRLECGRATADLVNGTLADGATIRRLDIVDGGVVTKRVDYPNESDLVLEIVIGPERDIEVFLLPDEVYRSNLNRMFVLGEYDRTLFEEVVNEVPRLRVFRRVGATAPSRER